MIIDTHVHLASWSTLKECKKNILYSMEHYGISYSLISNCDCSEFPSTGDRYPIRKVNQYQGLKECLEFARKYPDRFGVLVWFNPNTQKLSSKFKELIEANLDIIHGFKFHPYESRIRITNKKLIPYLNYIDSLGLPLLVHTAKDPFSSIFFLESAAKKYPNINFIAAHLQLLESNKSKAISLMKRCPNIYADTAWVSAKDAKAVLRKVGIDRICYGSDNPIDGTDTYQNPMYTDYFENKVKFSKDEIDHVLYLNAAKIYNIDVSRTE